MTRITTNTSPSFNDSELSLLQAIREAEGGDDKLTQRDLARRTGVSLGMVNALLKRLAAQGWVRFSTISAKSLSYTLTSAGVAELARRSSAYFSGAARGADLFRDRLDSYVLREKRGGASTIVLLGSSEIDFLLAHVCERHALVFVQSADIEKARALGRKPGVRLVLANPREEMPGSACLSDIIVGTADAEAGRERGRR